MGTDQTGIRAARGIVVGAILSIPLWYGVLGLVELILESS